MEIFNIDLARDADTGASYHVYNPITQELLFSDDDPNKPFIVKVIGANSSKLKFSGGKVAKANGDVASRLALADYLSIAVTGWENLEKGGEVLPFSRENCKKIFADPVNDWLAKQLVEFISDLGNFKSVG